MADGDNIMRHYAIEKYVLDHAGEQFSARDIENYLRNEYALTANRMTIYKTLKVLDMFHPITFIEANRRWMYLPGNDG